jgi:hypothetical protein
MGARHPATPVSAVADLRFRHSLPLLAIEQGGTEELAGVMGRLASDAQLDLYGAKNELSKDGARVGPSP